MTYYALVHINCEMLEVNLFTDSFNVSGSFSKWEEEYIWLNTKLVLESSRWLRHRLLFSRWIQKHSQTFNKLAIGIWRILKVKAITFLHQPLLNMMYGGIPFLVTARSQIFLLRFLTINEAIDACQKTVNL